MIVKEAPNRHDGKSDFGDLARYLTVQMDDDVRELPGFGQLTSYVADDTDATGEEKCVAVSLNKLNSIDTAAKEFYAVAAKNTRVANPVKHFILSWPEHERPSYEDIFDAGRKVLQAINLDEHQFLMAIHANTDNIHCHIEVSTVHPETYRSQHLPWLHKNMHKAARHIEIEKGWTHDNGLFVVRELPDGRKFVVPNEGYREKEGLGHDPYVEKVAQLEAWTDTDSLINYCQKIVAYQVAKTATEAKDWAPVHDKLAAHGMKLNKTGGGGWQLEAINQDGEVLHVPLSKAIRKLKPTEMEKKLGEFVPSTKPLEPKPATDLAAQLGRQNRPPRELKRDPAKREARRLERAQERTQLIDRFHAETSLHRAKADIVDSSMAAVTAWKNKEVKQMKQRFAKRREDIRGNRLFSLADKKLHFSLLAIERLEEKLRIDAEANRRRDQLRETRPQVLSWREWVEREARAGDKAAISALRGMVYEEGRKRRRNAQNAELEADNFGEEGEGVEDPEKVLEALLSHEREENAIRPVQLNLIKPYQADVLLKNLAGVRWKVTNNGNVQYQNKNGGLLFVDKGNKLTFDRKLVTDDDLKLALLHSREKWGNRIVLTGADAVFMQRMVKAAVELGMEVGNPDLHGLQAMYQKQQDGKPRAARTRGKPVTAPTEVKAKQASPAGDLRGKITEQIQLGQPGSTVVPAAVDGQYQGEITHHNDEWVAQRIGKASFVLHARADLGGKVPSGMVDVQYRAGKGVITPLSENKQKSAKTTAAKPGKGRAK